MRDDEDAPDGSVPDSPLWAADLVVPDDISELADEVTAYQRELRAARRRSRRLQLTAGPWSRRLVVPLMALLILCAGVSGSLLASLAPQGAGSAVPRPLAHPTQAAGQIGGLLPDVAVSSADGPVHLLKLRPAILVLVPVNCRCPAVLDHLAGQAEEVGLAMVLLASPSGAAQLPALISRMHVGSPQGFVDTRGQLWSAYRPAGVTVVMLAPNGEVPFPVVRNAGNGTRLDAKLFALLS